MFRRHPENGRPFCEPVKMVWWRIISMSGCLVRTGKMGMHIKPRNRFRRRNQAVRSGRFFTVYDRTSACQQRTEDGIEEEDADESGDDMRLTSLQSITDFMNCAGKTLPDNIRLWAKRNLAVARSNEVSPEERRHAQRALSTMMNIQWKNNYFESIDPEEARRIPGRRAVRHGEGETAYHRDHHPDQPYPYASGLWPSAGRTSRNR